MSKNVLFFFWCAYCVRVLEEKGVCKVCWKMDKKSMAEMNRIVSEKMVKSGGTNTGKFLCAHSRVAVMNNVQEFALEINLTSILYLYIWVRFIVFCSVVGWLCYCYIPFLFYISNLNRYTYYSIQIKQIH